MTFFAYTQDFDTADLTADPYQNLGYLVDDKGNPVPDATPFQSPVRHHAKTVPDANPSGERPNYGPFFVEDPMYPGTYVLASNKIFPASNLYPNLYPLTSNLVEDQTYPGTYVMR
jgi:hypothetical protein